MNSSHPNNHPDCLTVSGTPILDDPFDAGGRVESEPSWVSPSYTDGTWLQQWSHLTLEPAALPRVPPAARAIITPLILPAWRHLLISHQHRELVHFFLQGLTHGFRIGYTGPSGDLKSTKRNLQSALYHPEVVDQYLATEVRENRIAGPFPSGTILAAHISRFGVIPKAHQPNKWCLIVDLSHPQGKSVNDGIPKELCSMAYITIDDAVQRIMGLGRGTLMAKIDIKSAFRLIPVHPADRRLLAMAWRDVIYIDTCLPFGLRSAPKLFNILADLLEWILKHLGVTFVLHYLDDFLTMGSPDTSECHHNLQLLIEVCQMLGIPLAIAKVEGPTTVLEFLGILLDTTRMEARLPEDKLIRVQTTVREWISKKKATKREILSLVGLLQHAAKVVHPGRTFVHRMYSVAARVPELDYYTRLNKEFRSDLSWWQLFLNSWNGVSFLKLTAMPQVPDLTLQTDASGSWECTAFCSGKWLQ